tara:strand:- start:1206 stop:1535 length:330 start_codon:yes stop_codon:yes gene_type:complete
MSDKLRLWHSRFNRDLDGDELAEFLAGSGFEQFGRENCPCCNSTNLLERQYPRIMCLDCDTVFFAHDPTLAHFFADGEIHYTAHEEDFCEVSVKGGKYNPGKKWKAMFL